MMKRTFLLGTVFLALLCVVSYSLYPRIAALLAPQDVPTLLAAHDDNDLFARGHEAYISGDYAEAAELFERSLDAAGSINEEAYIKRFWGAALILAGNYKEGVAVLKSVADNENYGDTDRAYTIALMGELYENTGRDPVFSEQLFSTEPYTSFLKGHTEREAFARLYDYASSFYPTATTLYHLAVADFYAASSTEAELREAIRAIAEERRMHEAANIDSVVLAESLLDEANLEALLSLQRGDSGENAEALFKKAHELSREGTSLRIKVSYYYALFLSQKAPERSADIARILAPFYEPRYAKTSFFVFLSGERARSDQRIGRNVARIAAVDPRFKALMQSLGWRL